jgi:hypothetical protein
VTLIKVVCINQSEKQMFCVEQRQNTFGTKACKYELASSGIYATLRRNGRGSKMSGWRHTELYYKAWVFVVSILYVIVAASLRPTHAASRRDKSKFNSVPLYLAVAVVSDGYTEVALLTSKRKTHGKVPSISNQ